MLGGRADDADCTQLDEDWVMVGDDEFTGSVVEVERGSSRLRGQCTQD